MLFFFAPSRLHCPPLSRSSATLGRRRDSVLLAIRSLLLALLNWHQKAQRTRGWEARTAPIAVLSAWRSTAASLQPDSMCEKYTLTTPLKPSNTLFEPMAQPLVRPPLQPQHPPRPPTAPMGPRQQERRTSAPPPLRAPSSLSSSCRPLGLLRLQRPPPLLLVPPPLLNPPLLRGCHGIPRRFTSSTQKPHPRPPPLLLACLPSLLKGPIDLSVIQFRSSRSNRHLQHENVPRVRGGVGGPIDHDPTEGLPVKKWQLTDVTVKQVEKDEDGDEAKTGSVNPDYPWTELPLPKDFYQLPPHSQVSAAASVFSYQLSCHYLWQPACM